MILHIPHASRMIPENFRDQIVLSDDDLSAELTLMTDAFTGELFGLPETATIRFPISRLLVDVERFPDDDEEPMSKFGMGMIYTLTASGKKLKRKLQPQEKRNIISQYYEPHHRDLLFTVNEELEKYGKVLIIDCHSFPSQPLPCDLDQTIPRPDFCIGTDSFHTPGELTEATMRKIHEMGYNVGINRPYAGSLVPFALYGKDHRVASIMIEINRALYMNEVVGTKNNGFYRIKEQTQFLLNSIREFEKQAEPVVRRHGGGFLIENRRPVGKSKEPRPQRKN